MNNTCKYSSSGRRLTAVLDLSLLYFNFRKSLFSLLASETFPNTTISKKEMIPFPDHGIKKYFIAEIFLFILLE